MGDTIDDGELEKIVDFFLKYSHYTIDRERAKEWIKLHLGWKTCFIMYDAKEIAAICRWNIEDEGKTTKVLDLYIREDWRGKKVIQLLTERALHIFPTLKQISFERQIKYPGREFRTISISRILQRS
jgi:hypothetical protein